MPAEEVVVPVCEPGYKDRTGGKAGFESKSVEVYRRILQARDMG